MNCADIQENISLYIDGLLNGYDKQLIKDHLSECQDCAQEYAILEANTKALKSIPQVDLPEGFKDKLHSKLKIEQKKSKMKHYRSYSVVAAALLIMVVSVLHNEFFNNTRWIESTLEEEASGIKPKGDLGSETKKEHSDNVASEEYSSPPPKMASMTEERVFVAVINDSEGYVTIKDEKAQSAVDYIKEYVSIFSYYTEIEVSSADDEGTIIIQLQVSSDGFDLLFDHITSYPSVTDFSTSFKGIDKEKNSTAAPEDERKATTENISLSETEPQSDSNEPSGVDIKLDNHQEGRSTIIVEIISQ